ncbi:MAG: hypothetical protein WCW78_00915 [Candidatus Paceibacterota bacterium]|jgi:hypothetical protein
MDYADKIKKEKTSFSWSAPEYEHFEKDSKWFSIMGAIAFGIVVVAFWKQDFFFGLFIILAAGLVFFFGKQEPTIYDFAIDSRGITIGKKLYPLGSIENFAFLEKHGKLHELIIKKKTQANPYVHIPIEGKLAKDVRSFLITRLPEVEYKETLIDVFTELLGF